MQNKINNMGFGSNRVVSYFHDLDVGNFHYGMEKSIPRYFFVLFIYLYLI